MNLSSWSKSHAHVSEWLLVQIAVLVSLDSVMLSITRLTNRLFPPRDTTLFSGIIWSDLMFSLIESKIQMVKWSEERGECVCTSVNVWIWVSLCPGLGAYVCLSHCVPLVLQWLSLNCTWTRSLLSLSLSLSLSLTLHEQLLPWWQQQSGMPSPGQRAAADNKPTQTHTFTHIHGIKYPPAVILYYSAVRLTHCWLVVNITSLLSHSLLLHVLLIIHCSCFLAFWQQLKHKSKVHHFDFVSMVNPVTICLWSKVLSQ